MLPKAALAAKWLVADSQLAVCRNRLERSAVFSINNQKRSSVFLRRLRRQHLYPQLLQFPDHLRRS